MLEHNPHTLPTPDPDTRRGANLGLLSAAALLVIAFAVGLFFWSTAHNQTASGNNAAPSLTTGSATSSPNSKGVTPPASR